MGVLGTRTVAGFAADGRQIRGCAADPVSKRIAVPGDVTAQTGRDRPIGGGQPGICTSVPRGPPAGKGLRMTSPARLAAEIARTAAYGVIEYNQRPDRRLGCRPAQAAAGRQQRQSDEGRDLHTGSDPSAAVDSSTSRMSTSP